MGLAYRAKWQTLFFQFGLGEQTTHGLVWLSEHRYLEQQEWHPYLKLCTYFQTCNAGN
jgi:hypothetical protein